MGTIPAKSEEIVVRHVLDMRFVSGLHPLIQAKFKIRDLIFGSVNSN
jgi:hypothetical protein